jgi:xylan 1,4-beta-xylosidase
MTIRLAARADAPATPLVHYWSRCVGAGRANEGLRADWQAQLKLAVEHCGFRAIRFHGLFHDDMFIYRREADGREVYNWQYLDQLFDALLAAGIRPFVELGFCPKGMDGGERNDAFWWKGNAVMPADLAAWGRLVEAMARHCIARYGRDEVLGWRFEVWNEPNLPYFFKPSRRSLYLELYRASALALKRVDPGLQVGGPASANYVYNDRHDHDISTSDDWLPPGVPLQDLPFRAAWLEYLMDWCAAERLPCDFVSAHPYPTDWALDEPGKGRGFTRPLGATPKDLRWTRGAVAKGPFPQAEIHLTEWNSSPSARDHHHDFPQAATFLVHELLGAIGLVDSLSYWTFTDVFEENGAGDTIWHGGFGMINLQGIVKPAFHGYRMLARLGDELLTRIDGGVITRRDGRLQALACHYPAEQPLALPPANTAAEAHACLALGQPRRLHLELAGLAPGASFRLEILDRGHGWGRGAWEAMGSPEPPTREQAAALRQAAWATRQEILTSGPDGRLVVDRELAPWAVALVEQI